MDKTDKLARYALAQKQIEALASGENDAVALMANTATLLKDSLQFFWVGFYRVVGDELVLGPFQGPVACIRIKKGRGVCGHCWGKGATVIVDDVDAFPGHIACSSLSRSEIVVPLKDRSGAVRALIDIDSTLMADFDQTDADALEHIANTLSDRIF